MVFALLLFCGVAIFLDDFLGEDYVDAVGGLRWSEYLLHFFHVDLDLHPMVPAGRANTKIWLDFGTFRRFWQVTSLLAGEIV